MAKKKVLYISHNHPSVRPGGAEGHALELYEAMRASSDFEPILLAKGGPPLSNVRQPHLGTLLGQANSDPNQYFFYTESFEYDWFIGTVRNKEMYTKHLRDFLAGYQPDVIHIQHTAFFGYDVLRQIRNVLPNSVIVYTLHEYLPICHRQGQMLRAQTDELCHESSPRRCHECFPSISPQDFFLRKQFILSHFALVDLFLAPSRFLRDRYIAWGIPADKIRYEPNGRPAIAALPDADLERPRNRLGFFGQFTPYKGVNVLLRAMSVLAEEERRARLDALSSELWGEVPAATGVAAGNPRLWLFGANLELQAGTFQNEFRELLKAAEDRAKLAGRYQPADLPRLMAGVDWVVMPSIWWENAPLVIQEAFQLGRPVICSDIGGMAEFVDHEVNGLHFRTGDPLSLAQSIRRATGTPGLWEQLRRGIPPVYRVTDQAVTLSALYRELLDQKQRAQRGVESYVHP